MTAPKCFIAAAKSELRFVDKEREDVIATLQNACEIVTPDRELNSDTLADQLFDRGLNVLHYAGHAGANSLRFEGGDAHALGLVATLRECSSLDLVFLNGCATREIAEQLTAPSRETRAIPVVIATVADVDDEAAYHFAVKLYERLVRGEPVGRAFRRALAATQMKSEWAEGRRTRRHVAAPQDVWTNDRDGHSHWFISTSYKEAAVELAPFPPPAGGRGSARPAPRPPGADKIGEHTLSDDDEEVRASGPHIHHIRALEPYTNLERVFLDATMVRDLTPLKNHRRLTTLSLASTRVDDLTPIRDLHRLRVLVLDGCEQLKSLAPIRALTELTELHVDGTNISSLEPMHDLVNMESLRACDTPVRDVEPLAKLHGLKELRLNGTRVAKLDALGNAGAIETLSLAHAKLVAELTGLERLDRLQKLDLNDTGVSGIGPLRACRSLKHLSLDRTQVSNLDPLAHTDKLNYLSLQNTQVSDLSPLQSHKYLSGLLISNTRVGSLEGLSRSAELSALRADNCPFDTLSPLSGLAKLRNLSVASTRVTSLDALRSLSGLTILNISNTAVSDLTPLVGLRSLKTLVAENTSVSDLTPLEGLENLISVSLRGTRADDAAVDALRAARPRLRITR